MGTVLNVVQSQAGWFGEGDDLFYVDGAKRAQIRGTGSEDYFNDAWDLRVSGGLWTGIPVTGEAYLLSVACPGSGALHDLDPGGHRA